MELAHLKALVAVAREGNLTRAAAQLNLSQPAVSLQIKNLQEMLGLTLFNRGSHGLTLTYDGLKLLPHVQRAVAAAEEVRRTAFALRSETGGMLKIGTILDPAHAVPISRSGAGWMAGPHRKSGPAAHLARACCAALDLDSPSLRPLPPSIANF